MATSRRATESLPAEPGPWEGTREALQGWSACPPGHGQGRLSVTASAGDPCSLLGAAQAQSPSRTHHAGSRELRAVSPVQAQGAVAGLRAPAWPCSALSALGSHSQLPVRCTQVQLAPPSHEHPPRWSHWPPSSVRHQGLRPCPSLIRPHGSTASLRARAAQPWFHSARRPKPWRAWPGGSCRFVPGRPGEARQVLAPSAPEGTAVRPESASSCLRPLALVTGRPMGPSPGQPGLQGWTGPSGAAAGAGPASRSGRPGRRGVAGGGNGSGFPDGQMEVSLLPLRVGRSHSGSGSAGRLRLRRAKSWAPSGGRAEPTWAGGAPGPQGHGHPRSRPQRDGSPALTASPSSALCVRGSAPCSTVRVGKAPGARSHSAPPGVSSGREHVPPGLCSRAPRPRPSATGRRTLGLGGQRQEGGQALVTSSQPGLQPLPQRHPPQPLASPPPRGP